MPFHLHQPNVPAQPVAIHLQRREQRLHLVFQVEGQVLALSAEAAAWQRLFNLSSDDPPGGRAGGDMPATIPPRRQLKNWEWLTPRMVVEYFEQSAILYGLAADLRRTLLDTPLVIDEEPLSQVEQDMATVEPFLGEIIRANGTVNKSEAARRLGIAPGGSSNWQRLNDLEREILKNSASSTSSTTPEEVEEAEKAFSTGSEGRRRAA